jgi:hypothetical protein
MECGLKIGGSKLLVIGTKGLKACFNPGFQVTHSNHYQENTATGWNLNETLKKNNPSIDISFASHHITTSFYFIQNIVINKPMNECVIHKP